jgi:hypothetical protein
VTNAFTHSFVTSQTIAVEHISIHVQSKTEQDEGLRRVSIGDYSHPHGGNPPRSEPAHGCGGVAGVALENILIPRSQFLACDAAAKAAPNDAGGGITRTPWPVITFCVRVLSASARK